MLNHYYLVRKRGGAKGKDKYLTAIITEKDALIKHIFEREGKFIDENAKQNDDNYNEITRLLGIIEKKDEQIRDLHNDLISFLKKIMDNLFFIPCIV
jgi:hypothetical protein